LRQFRWAFVGMNLAYFGVVLTAMLLVVFHRQTQQALLSSVTAAFQTTPISEAYAGGTPGERNPHDIAVKSDRRQPAVLRFRRWLCRSRAFVWDSFGHRLGG